LSSQAGTITFTGIQVDLNGTGFGNVLNLLSVQNTDSEFGSVLWNGAADVLTDNATNTSKTQTAAVMQSVGIGSTFSAIYNGNEPGNASSSTLHGFKLHFQGADGSSLFDLLYTAPAGGLSISDFGGTGQAGWIFAVSLAGNEAAQFFGNGANRVGMSIDRDEAIGDVAGGAENFFLHHGTDGPSSGGGGEPTPEPGSIAVWMIAALAAIQGARVRRRTKIANCA
jgi:hypothetical protein